MLNFYPYLQYAGNGQPIYPNMIQISPIFYSFNANVFSSTDSSPEITQSVESKIEAIPTPDSDISLAMAKRPSYPKKKRIVKVFTKSYSEKKRLKFWMEKSK